MTEFTHLDASGAARMVDVTGKPPTVRQATAEALVAWANGRGGQDNITVALIRLGDPTKG